MNAITIKKLSPQALRELAQRASAHHHTIEEEAAEIIEQTLVQGQAIDWRLQRADHIAAMTPKGVVQTVSTLLIREERDR